MAVEDIDGWPAVLTALRANPRDAPELVATLRAPPLDGQFAAVSDDDLDGVPIMLRAAEAELHDAFAEPCALRDSSAIAFVVDRYEWVIGGVLRANPAWPADGGWHDDASPVALLHRPERHVLCGSGVTRLAVDILGRGCLYTALHVPYEIRAASSLSAWAGYVSGTHPRRHGDRRPT